MFLQEIENLIGVIYEVDLSFRDIGTMNMAQIIIGFHLR